MTWIETTSLTFSARHEDSDRSYAESLLDRLEELSLRLEDRFETVPGEVTIIVHPSPIWLTMAHPFLPAVRWSAAPPGSRYLPGWPMATTARSPLASAHHSASFFTGGSGSGLSF